jgi:hypothetical protein
MQMTGVTISTRHGLLSAKNVADDTKRQYDHH